MSKQKWPTLLSAFPPSRKVLEIASGMLSRFASIFADGQLDLSQDFNARATDPASSIACLVIMASFQLVNHKDAET